MPPPSRALIIPAAGSGSRFGASGNKLFAAVAGRPILARTLACIARLAWDQVVLVCRPEERAAVAALAAEAGLNPDFADGGPTRQASVARGLRHVRPEVELVAVHDAARPLCPAACFEAALDSAARHGSGVAALPVTDSLRRAEETVCRGEQVDRDGLWAMQTPQAFRAELLRAAFARAAVTGLEATDEVGLVTAAGGEVRLVPGSPRNLKITRPEDLALAAALLGGGAPRIGFGYDIHAFSDGRELWLGGVRIDHPRGLLGHSDADALLHAVCDALLGAAGLPDIGHLFPNTDPAYAGAAGLRLLAEVIERARSAGYRVGNVDVTVIAREPRLAPHLPAMRAAMAPVLGVAPHAVGLKATTNEGLDALGAGEGIAAHAVALLLPLEGDEHACLD